MAYISWDTSQECEAQERNGTVERMVRHCTVFELPGFYGDARILAEALLFLDSLGVTVNTAAWPGAGLVLTERNPRLIPGERTKVDVELVYTIYGRLGYDFVFSVEASLNQIETQNDRYGNQITVQHTYAADHPEFPSETHTQGGSVSAMAPQTVIRAEGLLFVQYPITITNQWMGAINGAPWIGAAPYTWMCTEVKATAEDLSRNPPWWRFTFEFQHNVFGWVPQAVFIDPSTGRVPAGIVPGVGAVNVDWYPLVDFNVIFPI